MDSKFKEAVEGLFNEEESSLTEVNTETTEVTTEAPIEKAAEPIIEKTEPIVETPPIVNEWEQKAKEYELKIKEYEEKVSSIPDEDSVFANPTIKKLNQLAKAGINVDSEDFWKWQAVDLDKFSPDKVEDALQLKRLELKVDRPELSNEEVERLLRRTYKNIMSGDYIQEDEEYQEALLDLKIDAKSSRTKLQKHKEAITLPKVDLKAKEQEEESRRQALENYKLTVKSEVNNYAEETLSLDEGLEIKYKPSDEAKKFVERSLLNDTSFFYDNYFDKESGKVDFKRAKRDLTRIVDYDRQIKLAYEQGVSKGKESVADVLENSSVDIQGQKAQIEEDFNTQIFNQVAAKWKR
jgi:hypothetical protein